MRGGPSHVDTFDLKPEAPSDIRGPFRAIRTNVPGVEISEIFPRLAGHAEKFSLIRSVYHSDNKDHAAGLALLPQPTAGTTVINIGAGNDWDAHGWGPFPSLSSYRDGAGATFDRVCSTLLRELAESDQLRSTMVLATGEFGRTPRLNPQGGRDHWPGCWTVLVAGGGYGGEVIGSSDAAGGEPRDNPISIQSLLKQLGFV